MKNDLELKKEDLAYCPICRQEGLFKSFGAKPRPRAQCPRCGALERHRVLWLYLGRRTRWFTKPKLKILHVAPEPFFVSIFAQIFKNYIIAEPSNPATMVQMDMQNIQYPDHNFDAIMCNHILQQMPSDIKVMSEFFRVLNKGGEFILLEPVYSSLEKTYEDPSINTPEGRLKAFGQKNNMRKYGRDFAARLGSVGFSVKETRALDFLSESELKRMALTNEPVFHCRK